MGITAEELLARAVLCRRRIRCLTVVVAWLLGATLKHYVPGRSVHLKTKNRYVTRIRT